jgi:hypothetical protein
LVSTTGAVVALVAIAAMMTSSTVAAPSAHVEARQSVREGAAVRAAVAAVAAAARHLVAGDRLMHALPGDMSITAAVPSIVPLPRMAESRSIAAATFLPERLLDLPPPVM